jgi:hypothetical protein
VSALEVTYRVLTPEEVESLTLSPEGTKRFLAMAEGAGGPAPEYLAYLRGLRVGLTVSLVLWLAFAAFTVWLARVTG